MNKKNKEYNKIELNEKVLEYLEKHNMNPRRVKVLLHYGFLKFDNDDPSLATKILKDSKAMNSKNPEKEKFIQRLIKKFPKLKNYSSSNIINIYRSNCNLKDDLICFSNKFKDHEGYKEYYSECNNVPDFDRNRMHLFCKECKSKNNYKKLLSKAKEIKLFEKHGVTNVRNLPGVDEKVKKTNLEKYGVENVSQSEKGKEKYKRTMLKKYGVVNPTQLQEIKEKVKKTNFEKYGVENISKLPEIREKAKKTMLEKYGVENALQSKEFKEKYKKTMLEKYGVEYALQSKKLKEKAEKTLLKKYGVKTPFESQEIREKMKKANLEKYGVEYPIQSLEIREKAKETFTKKYNSSTPFGSKEIQEKIKKENLEKYGVENISKLPEIKENVKCTNLEKYGVEYPMQSPVLKEKYKKTMLEKYGVEYAFQSEEFKEKYRKTMLEKYGVEYPLQTFVIQEKVKMTNLEKYGVENPMQSAEIQMKTKETNLEKYGVEYPSQSPIIKEKIKMTNLERFGVECPPKLNIIKEKIKQTTFERYGVENFKQSHLKNLDKLNKEYILEHFIDKDNHFIVKDFMKFYNCKDSIAYKYLKKFNINYTKYQGTSSPEYEIIDYIKNIENELSIKNKIIHGDRKIIAPFELDIYIPEKKLAIEYNGLYWHSYSQFNNISPKQSDLKYQKHRHLKKTEACESKNINLLHIFENEWLDPIKQDIWKSVIGYKLGITKERYFARKLKIKKISSNEARVFFDENHLQGGQAPGNIAYGLYDNNELISCMTFGKSRFNKKYEYELIRFASKKYTACVGCAQRLFKTFIKEFNPSSIISYANRRWASALSNLYQSLNFKELKPAEPNYFYFKLYNNNENIEGIPILKSRNVFQKHKLKDHPETKNFYDENKSESEIMSEAGFRRIYDVGNLVYLWEKS